MTILFVTHYTELYGANRSMLTLIRLLQSKYAVQPIVVVPYRYGPLMETLVESNIEHHYIPYCRWILTNMDKEQSKYKYVKWFVKNIYYALKIKNLFKSRRIDVVYSNSITINIGALIAYVMRIPHIWHIRELISGLGLKLAIPRFLSKPLINLSTNKRYILLSNSMVREFQRILPQNRIRMIYNGVSLSKRIGSRLCNQNMGTLQLACVGLLCHQKNQMELLKALVILKGQKCKVHVHFIGRDEQGYEKEMMNYIVQQDISDLVTFHGHTDNVFELLEECNLGIVTAIGEAFGRVTVEFMLMSMPVVASDSGANPELIDSGLTGMVYHLGDVEELAKAIQTYIKTPSLLAKHGRKAYSKAIKEFSAERNAELIYSEMLDVINEKK